ncbi:hypothetical protein [Lacticaseibacillus daqingensis]|uniref:hypothetical protein n=1 Tax=Lacticaseibacillus daqingensis TaxID=2486014 RepID=UPI000F76AAD6|nr:hypothetical protein [Lacticaseibacillus daqingensis]
MTDKLWTENQQYYDRIEAYVTAAFYVDPAAAQDTLAEIHADLLQAQASGQSAAAYFGQAPQPIAAGIVANLPRRRGSDWLMMGAFFWGVPFFIFLWRQVMNGRHPVALGTAAVMATLMLAGVVGLALWRRHRAFAHQSKLEVKFLGGTTLIAWLLMVPVGETLLPKMGLVAVPPVVIVAVSLGLWALGLAGAAWLDSVHSWFLRAFEALLLLYIAWPLPAWLGWSVGGLWFGAAVLVGNVLLIWVLGALLPAKHQAQ